jgi:iron complex transport system substrate-binding protein
VTRTLALLALLLALATTACGSDDPSDAGGSSSGTDAVADGASEGSGGPVTIDHVYGSTTVAETPERIVALDNQWLDVLLALDGPVVGAALDPQVEDGGRYPWQDVPEEVEGIEVTDAIPYERVAALQPDLIVISWAAETEDVYEQLTGIAPTVATLGDRQVDTWQDITTAAGEILGQEDEAAALIQDVEGQTAAVADELPGLDGKTYALANYVPGDAIYVVADPDDGAATFFAQLGLQIDPELLEIADGATGRVEISLERIDELDSDLLLLLTNGADPADIPGYDALPAVESGAVAILDLPTAVAVNTPSPLSLPWALDELRPALAAAAGG